MINFLILLLTAALNSLASVLLKMGLRQIPEVPLGNWILLCAQNLLIFGGVGCYVMSLIFWLWALSRVEIGYGVSVLSLGYVFSIFAGILFFKETLSVWRFIGVILIVGGIYCVSRSNVPS